MQGYSIYVENTRVMSLVVDLKVEGFVKWRSLKSHGPLYCYSARNIYKLPTVDWWSLTRLVHDETGPATLYLKLRLTQISACNFYL